MREEKEESLFIPISYMNAYAYCPRRFYYEFVRGEMVVNEHVFEGHYLHENVDLPGKATREEIQRLRRIYLCAPKLGVSGYCDLLECDGKGEITQQAREGHIYPVEYKKGRMGKWLSDHTQVCLQALALEEVLGLPSLTIQRGMLFYFESGRREEVILTENRRRHTLDLLAQARQLAHVNDLPLPLSNWNKCRDCSLEPLCLPRETIVLQKQVKGESDDSALSY